jgi:hypothetical protein
MSAEIANEVESFLKLLLAFRALPETKRRQTIMEVSGYPHFENVCSNILEFYFDPSAEHGLKDLLLSSFLSMAKAGDVEIPDKVKVIREYPVGDQQRIDLVVDCETFTLGIENKIYHWEANDFENYAQVIERLGANKKVLKAVLCLKKEANQAQPKGDFKRYTYDELWKQVRGMLGTYISQGDPKWVTCLLDFMETTTNLAGGNMEHKKLDQFFIEYDELITQMVTARDAFLARQHQKVAQLVAMMRETAESKQLSEPPWIYQKSCLVLDFNLKQTHKITLDLFLTTKGWKLTLLGRNESKAPGSKAYLAKLVKQPALKTQVGNAQIVGERYIVKTWSIETDLDEIREALRSWIRAIIDADAAEPV